MLLLVAFFSHQLCVFGESCGVPAIKPRMPSNSGDEASPYSWPWQVGLIFQPSVECVPQWPPPDGRISCEGTLIANQWIMTAGRCVEKYRDLPHCFDLKLGVFEASRDDEPGEQVLVNAISDIYVHPNLSGDVFDGYRYDVALLKLKEPIVFTDHILPVCLPTKQDEGLPDPGNTVVVTGWGLPWENSYKDRLQQISVPVSDSKKCKDLYAKTHERWIIDETNMFCAGDGRGKNACQGGFGGPLVSFDSVKGTWKQIGITSWHATTTSIGCPGEQLPLVYAKVSGLLDFIQRYLNPSSV